MDKEEIHTVAPVGGRQQFHNVNGSGRLFKEYTGGRSDDLVGDSVSLV